jgi:hypothetical protein
MHATFKVPAAKSVRVGPAMVTSMKLGLRRGSR